VEFSREAQPRTIFARSFALPPGSAMLMSHFVRYCHDVVCAWLRRLIDGLIDVPQGDDDTTCSARRREPMPKSKHRRKGETRARPPRTQGNAKHRIAASDEWLSWVDRLAERGERIMERCRQLYGPRPDDEYGVIVESSRKSTLSRLRKSVAGQS